MPNLRSILRMYWELCKTQTFEISKSYVQFHVVRLHQELIREKAKLATKRKILLGYRRKIATGHPNKHLWWPTKDEKGE